MIVLVMLSLQSVMPVMGSLTTAHASDTPQVMHILVRQGPGCSSSDHDKQDGYLK